MDELLKINNEGIFQEKDYSILLDDCGLVCAKMEK
jgi:hypothetical protein